MYLGWLGGGLAGAVLLGWLAAVQPLLAVVLVGLAVLGWVMVTRPHWLIPAAIVSVALGQLGRIPPLSAGGPLFGDLLLGALVFCWMIWAIWKRVKIPFTKAHWVWAGFLAVALLALVFSPYPLSRGDFLGAALYWVRLFSYTALAWIIPTIYRSETERKTLFTCLVWMGGLVVLGGIIQLIALPDLRPLTGYGWDPHIGRFVSTFLDPNYLGGFLALFFALLVALSLQKVRWWMVPLGAATLIGTILTFSRSGYLALLVVLLVIGARYSWKLLLIAVLCVGPLGYSIPRVRERVQGAFRVDKTSQERILSWQRGFAVYSAHPVLGVGYNNYEIAQQELQLISVYGESHADSGSDSSLITVAATTGAVGFTLFVLAGFLLLRDAFRRVRLHPKKGSATVAAYTLLIGVPALLAHSFFVNGLFYPLLLLPVAVLIGLLYAGETE